MAGRAGAAVTLALAALASPTLTVGAPAQASTGISRGVRAALLRVAIGEARGMGELHPYDIQAVRTTLAKATLAEGSGIVGPAFARMPVYLIALRGHFVCGAGGGRPCHGPPGSKAPGGRVLTLELEVGSLRVFGRGLSSRLRDYPRMTLAGRPVRLALALSTPPARGGPPPSSRLRWVAP